MYNDFYRRFCYLNSTIFVLKSFSLNFIVFEILPLNIEMWNIGKTVASKRLVLKQDDLHVLNLLFWRSKL